MSPLWRNWLRFRAHPSRCARLHLGATGWRLDTGELPHAGTWGDLTPTAQTLAVSLNPALGSALVPAQAAAQAAAQCKQLAVVLDAHWARTQLIHYPPALRERRERQGYVEALLRDTHGVDPTHWQILVEPCYGDEAVFACAIEQATLTALQTLAKTHGLRLISVQAAFVACWQACRQQVTSVHGALAWLADGRVSLGVWQHSQWLALRTKRLQQTEAGAADLTPLLQLMLTSNGYAIEGGILYLAGDKPLPTPTPAPGSLLPAGWTAQTLVMAGGGA